MAMTRWDPFTEMVSMQQMMDRLLDRTRFNRGWGDAGMGGIDLDVMERDDALVVKASLPGVKPEDINVSVERNMLTIQGEMREEEERGEGRYHHRERRFGRFARSFMLPSDVNSDACDASFEHGVLTITLPKSEQARSRKIAVRGERPAIEGQRGNGQTAQNRSEGDVLPAEDEQRRAGRQG
jgi:HSP20 family protein